MEVTMPNSETRRGMSPRLSAVLARFCQRLGPLFSTQAVKLPYLVDVVANHLLGHPIANGTYQTWEHGVVAKEVFRFIKHEASGDPVFRIEPHAYSESGKLISLAGDPEIIAILSPDELAVVDFIADEYGHVAPEQLGYLTKRLNTEIPPETWGTNASAAVNEEAFLRLSPEWQNLGERISEQDLTDRTKWSEPINSDPMAYFMRALNG
ncbi:MAG TPA: Panacea domain-containing protein [Thermoanaerobaculia bacterium]|nr:Panacea domain-containing protein [Thermoanaerobaculia bacterium]